MNVSINLGPEAIAAAAAVHAELPGDIRSDHAGEMGAVMIYRGIFAVSRNVLKACQADEVHHRDEARALRAGEDGFALRLWTWLVCVGSKSAVAAARRI